MKQKFWQKLLYEWRKDGNDGFTIPFIVGSQKYLPGTHSAQDVEDLIIDIAEDETFEIYIKPCMNTGDLVLGLKDDSRQNLAGGYLNFEDGRESNLFLNIYANDLGNSVESVAAKLAERYQQFVNDAEFSKNGKERGDFEPHEIDFIKGCYNEYYP
jgi:hypothetical protein